MFSGSSSFDNLLAENSDLANHIADVADAVDIDPRSTTIAFARPQSEALWETFGGLQAERFPGASEVALTAKLLDKTTRPATVGDDVYDLGDGVYLRFVGDVVYYVFSHDPNWLEASVGVVPK